MAFSSTKQFLIVIVYEGEASTGRLDAVGYPLGKTVCTPVNPNIAVAGKWSGIESMYLLLKMGIFQPAMLVCWRVSRKSFVNKSCSPLKRCCWLQGKEHDVFVKEVTEEGEVT